MSNPPDDDAIRVETTKVLLTETMSNKKTAIDHGTVENRISPNSFS